jgi:hypothetical protein
VKHEINIVCKTCNGTGQHGGTHCLFCERGGKSPGWIVVPLRHEVMHPRSPCCLAPWQSEPCRPFLCSACGKAFQRAEVVKP